MSNRTNDELKESLEMWLEEHDSTPNDIQKDKKGHYIMEFQGAMDEDEPEATEKKIYLPEIFTDIL